MTVFSEHGKHCNRVLNMANIAIALVKKKKTDQMLNDNNTYLATCIQISRWVLTIEATWNMQLQHLMPCLGHILAISELNIWLNHILQTVNNLLLVSFFTQVQQRPDITKFEASTYNPKVIYSMSRLVLLPFEFPLVNEYINVPVKKHYYPYLL